MVDAGVVDSTGGRNVIGTGGRVNRPKPGNWINSGGTVVVGMVGATVEVTIGINEGGLKVGLWGRPGRFGFPGRVGLVGRSGRLVVVKGAFVDWGVMTIGGGVVVVVIMVGCIVVVATVVSGVVMVVVVDSVVIGRKLVVNGIVGGEVVGGRLVVVAGT